MNYILFDGPARNNLLPFTFTRPVADIRIGILTIREKWENFLQATTTTITEEYLSERWPYVEAEENIMINASFLPTEKLVHQIKQLQKDQILCYEDHYVAFLTAEEEEPNLDEFTQIELQEAPVFIENPWDIFSKNAEAIQLDFEFLTKGRESAEIPEVVHCIQPGNIFIEEGAKLINGTLNASDGPIYIGKNAEVMEGCTVRGPFALCEHATLKMGTKIYGATTIGPHSKVGGEVNNSVILGYSNKGHDGFLGNSVIGEWCNLGADTNNSNLKNNYADVKLWNYEHEEMESTNKQFCGLMMGDHSKCGINTMFNTGTVTGVCANIFGAGFPPNFIPSFSWGGFDRKSVYQFDKACEVAQLVMQRRSIEFSAEDEAILKHVLETTKKFREK